MISEGSSCDAAHPIFTLKAGKPALTREIPFYHPPHISKVFADLPDHCRLISTMDHAVATSRILSFFKTLPIGLHKEFLKTLVMGVCNEIARGFPSPRIASRVSPWGTPKVPLTPQKFHV
jgi:hypothetical protein